MQIKNSFGFRLHQQTIFISQQTYFLRVAGDLSIDCVQFNYLTLGYQTSDSASSSKFHYLALLVALVSYSSNFQHWLLLALLVAPALH